MSAPVDVPIEVLTIAREELDRVVADLGKVTEAADRGNPAGRGPKPRQLVELRASAKTAAAIATRIALAAEGRDDWPGYRSELNASMERVLGKTIYF